MIAFEIPTLEAFAMEAMASLMAENLVQNQERQKVVQYFEPFRHLLYQIRPTLKYNFEAKVLRSFHVNQCSSSQNQNTGLALNLWLMAANKDGDSLLDIRDMLESKVLDYVLAQDNMILDRTFTARLASESVDKDANAFKYEIHDADLKSKLEKVLRKMPNVRHLILHNFVDDDVLSMVARINAKSLDTLEIKTFPLGCVDDHRLTDEGVCDFVDDILRVKPVLKQVDFSDVFVSRIQAKSILYFNKIPSLTNIKLQPQHLTHLDNAIAHCKSEDYRNKSVRQIAVKF